MPPYPYPAKNVIFGLSGFRAIFSPRSRKMDGLALRNSKNTILGLFLGYFFAFPLCLVGIPSAGISPEFSAIWFSERWKRRQRNSLWDSSQNSMAVLVPTQAVQKILNFLICRPRSQEIWIRQDFGFGEGNFPRLSPPTPQETSYLAPAASGLFSCCWITKSERLALRNCKSKQNRENAYF